MRSTALPPPLALRILRRALQRCTVDVEAHWRVARRTIASARVTHGPKGFEARLVLLP